MTNWILTYTGAKVDLLDPKPEQVRIADIAHALALTCRFNGHCREFYSVAQHSVEVMHLVGKTTNDPDVLMTALLHDAHEYVTSDIARPVKKLLTGVAEIEERVDAVVARVFGLITPLPDVVRRADDVMLATERRDLMHPDGGSWSLSTEPLADMVVMPMDWRAAEQMFLMNYNYVCNLRASRK